MDGTLIDSMRVWDTLAVEYLRRRGISPGDGLVGILSRMTMDEAVAYLKHEYRLTESTEEVLAGIEETVDTLYESVELKEGILPLLLTLRRAGVRMAVATLTDRSRVERVLGRLGILGLFDAVLTCADVGEGKTSPRIYEAALAHLGTEKTATPVFEDAFYALRTAHAAGFPTVAVYDDTPECHFESAAKISFLSVRDYRELELAPYL